MNIEDKILNGVRTQELIDEIKNRLQNGESSGGGNTLDINPSSATIADYPNGTLWLTSSNNEANLFTKVNGRKYALRLEESLDEIALKFSSDSNFTLSAIKNWDGTLEYTTNNGNTWTTWDGSELSGTASQPIYLRGTGNTVITGPTASSNSWTFTGKYCKGNIENLLDYQTVANGEHPVMDKQCYDHMFYGCTSLTQAPELPATTLASHCYSHMFRGCTSLTQAPELPATTLTESCYSYMFYECTSLTQAPELPATTLASLCYYFMFKGCTSLTQAPELPATTVDNQCYDDMFYGCTSLTQAPELPATTLATSCYQRMFQGCTSLTQVPKLPATTLVYQCYQRMFQGCTSLTQVPELPATTLASYCYAYMFQDCTSLKFSTTQTGEYQYAYRMPTTGTGTTATGAFTDMFKNTGGTFTSRPTINTTYYTTNQPV